MKTTKFLTGLFLTALAAAVAAPPAHAFPLPGVPTTAIFAFASAGDSDDLFLQGGPNPIFNNHANTPGDTFNLGVLSGPQIFGLNDLRTSTSFLTNVPDADGNYHAYYTANCNDVASCNAVYQDFSEGNLDPAVQTVIAGLPAGTDLVFVGWEDLTNGQGSDWDYNDLIFGFTNLAAVPEPTSMALLGAALMGFGIMRRRRSA